MNQLHWQNNRNTNNYRLLFAHLDNRQLRHVEVSGDVRADHRFKVLGCVFRERFWDINAGIVDEEINALEVPHSRISDPGSGLLLPMSPSPARTRSAKGFKSFRAGHNGHWLFVAVRTHRGEDTKRNLKHAKRLRRNRKHGCEAV